MLIMLGNNTGKAVKELWKKYPGNMAGMISLRGGGGDGWSHVLANNVPYAIDNGRYTATIKHKTWSRDDFFKLLDKAAAAFRQPLFVTVPDTVGSAKQTLDEWHEWQQCPKFTAYGFPLAYVAQDGVLLDDIPVDADVVFIGGTKPWKDRSIWRICHRFKNVHVGGINSGRGLWHCHNCGVTSVDGTGWMRGSAKQWLQLLKYLHRSNLNLTQPQRRLFALWEAEETGAGFPQGYVEHLLYDGPAPPELYEKAQAENQMHPRNAPVGQEAFEQAQKKKVVKAHSTPDDESEEPAGE